MAHGLQRMAEEARSNFTNINKFISAQKKSICENPTKCARNQLPDVVLPPEPVLTRWGTSIQAVNF
jgi:hypothetical protein